MIRTACLATLAALAVTPALATEQQVMFATDEQTNKIDVYNISGGLVTSFGDASLNTPQGIAQGAGGVIYVGGNQGYIEKYSNTGAYLGEFVNPSGSSTQVVGIATDSSGDVYATSGRNIYKYNSAGTLLDTYAASPSNVNGLFGIGLDSSGHVYVTADGPGGDKLYELNSSLGLITTVPVPTPTRGPYSVAISSDGYAYVTDDNYGITYKINLTTDAGTAFSAGSSAYAVAIDSAGLYAPSTDVFFSGFPGMVESTSSGTVISTITTPGDDRPYSLAFGELGSPPTPEPGSMALLLGSGAVGAGALLRRRRALTLRSTK